MYLQRVDFLDEHEVCGASTKSFSVERDGVTLRLVGDAFVEVTRNGVVNLVPMHRVRRMVALAATLELDAERAAGVVRARAKKAVPAA